MLLMVTLPAPVDWPLKPIVSCGVEPLKIPVPLVGVMPVARRVHCDRVVEVGVVIALGDIV
ncbi:hypothetical protein [Streptomyces sp. L7]|uniref:hypothetical protein n=1 Tax=Streptomyces sp. L7 TaxID=3423954 RepID=UPI003D959C2D